MTRVNIAVSILVPGLDAEEAAEIAAYAVQQGIVEAGNLTIESLEVVSP